MLQSLSQLDFFGGGPLFLWNVTLVAFVIVVNDALLKKLYKTMNN